MVSSTNASNILNSTIQQSIDIINGSYQDCAAPIGQAQSITVVNCNTIRITNVTLEQNVELDVECVQEALAENDLQTTISNQFAQNAQAINQALNLNVASTSAQSIVNLMQQLSETITNIYSQTCLPPSNQSQMINAQCTTSTGSIAEIDQVNLRQVQNLTANCVQQNSTVNRLKTEIENIIKQESSAVVQPIFTIGGIIIVLVLVLLILLVFFGGSAQNIIIIVIIIAAIIGIYLLIAWSLGLWPFLE